MFDGSLVQHVKAMDLLLTKQLHTDALASVLPVAALSAEDTAEDMESRLGLIVFPLERGCGEWTAIECEVFAQIDLPLIPKPPYGKNWVPHQVGWNGTLLDESFSRFAALARLAGAALPLPFTSRILWTLRSSDPLDIWVAILWWLTTEDESPTSSVGPMTLITDPFAVTQNVIRRIVADPEECLACIQSPHIKPSLFSRSRRSGIRKRPQRSKRSTRR